MKNILPFLAIAPLAFTSCDDKSAPQTGSASGAAAAPTAVNGGATPSFHSALGNVVGNLETNGSHFSVTHIDEDLKQLAKAADGLLDIARENSDEVPPNLSAVDLLNNLGLSKIDAMGRSSRSTGGAWHNRLFVQTNGDRSGLLSAMGGEGSEWRAGEFAPADADLVVEIELNLRRIMETMKALSTSFGEEAEQGLAEAMREKIAEGGMTLGDLLGKTDLRATLIVSLDTEKRWSPGEGIQLPAMDAALRIERGMWLWKQFGEAIEAGAEVSESDGLKIIKAPEEMDTPMGKLRPIIVLDAAKDLIWASFTEDYLGKCRSSEMKLAGSDDYGLATTGFPEKGNGIFYVSGDFCSELVQQVRQAGKNLPEGSEEAAGFNAVIGLLGFPTDDAASAHGYAWCVSNTKTGILCVGNSPFPDKGYGLMNSIAPISAMAGLAAPMVVKQRQKANQVMAVSNMRQLGLALFEYETEKGQYPNQLSDLVDAGILDGEMLDQMTSCLIDGESRPLVYIPGLSSSGNPGIIILHTPAPIDGKRIVARIDNSVTSMPEDEFLELIGKQQDRE